MKHWLFAIGFLFTATLLAQADPKAAQQTTSPEKPKPAVPGSQVAPPPKVTEETSAPVVRKEEPLSELPYTPSLDLSAMDPSADACTDFYQYVCGGWIAKNPIPGDQAAWSVYGKLAQDNQQFLWGLLEDAARPAADRNPTQQKIGDYFAACMDEPGIEKLGSAPLRPVLDEIAALKSTRDLASYLAREHLRASGNEFLFGFGSQQDFADATQVLASAAAGGLGLPDRDYYTKTDAKSKEIRAKYQEHVARMLELTGESRAEAAAHAKAVMGIETALAKASLTRVEQRDPYKLFHKMTPAQLKALAPSFDWTRYLAAGDLAGSRRSTSPSPPFQGHGFQIERSSPDWKAYLRWHAVKQRARTYCERHFVNRHFKLLPTTISAASPSSRRGEAVRAAGRPRPRRGAGAGVVRRTFAADTKQKTVDMTRRIEVAMEKGSRRSTG